MNHFCEECGNKLNPEDLFCEQCGTKVPRTEQEYETETKNSLWPIEFFRNKKLQQNLPSDATCGIIFTNLKKMSQIHGSSTIETFKTNLLHYIEQFNKLGLYYLLLDASDNYMKDISGNNWKHHVNLLRKATQQISARLNLTPGFLLLMGGTEIIPMPVFENPTAAKSSDKDVESDLPYSSLSVGSPLENSDARRPVLFTGRFPTGKNSTITDLLTLMGNTLNAIGNLSIQKTFGLSANCWQEVSSVINSHVAKEQLYISPGLTVDNLTEYYSKQTQLHYFNLHGSDKAPMWYGQKGNAYPVAFSPAAISQNSVFNVVGVEACYGARFIDLNREESILLSALANKTVSFVGSSRIAWGPSAPPMNLADVVISDYLSLIQQGKPAGVAFLEARVHAFNNSVERDPATSLLTLMEFNLFGDPAFFMQSSQNKIKASSKTIDMLPYSDLPESQLTTSKSQPDDSLYNTIRAAVDEAQRKITSLINKNVWEKYPEFKNIEPAFKQYQFEGKSFNNLTYKKEEEFFDKYINVSTNQQGDVLAEFESK